MEELAPPLAEVIAMQKINSHNKSSKNYSLSPSSSHRRKRRKRKKSSSKLISLKKGDLPIDVYGIGIRPRHRGEKRHRPLWDIEPKEAQSMGLLEGLPINIGQSGDFMHADRAGRRVYVGNLPLHVKENAIRDFFNTVMVAAQGPNRKPGDSVLGVFLNLKKRFAFIEFRSAVEATQAMDLDGIMFKGLSLKMGRPANYNASAASIASRTAPKLNLSRLGIVSSHVPNGPNKLYIGGLPYNLNETQVRELLETYGPLRGLFLSFDPVTGLTKGYAFCYYEDENVTDAAIDGLNGIQIGDKILQVRRHEGAQNYLKSNDSIDNKVNFQIQSQALPSQCICLIQCIDLEDLKDPEEVFDIKSDIENECSNYGTVLKIVIPSIINGNTEPGAGKVYIKFQSTKEAEVAKNSLQGRSFSDKTVIVSYFDTLRFDNQQF